MTLKRQTEAASPTPQGDAKLQRVVRALEGVTCTGVTFASGASERFPLPAIAFKNTQDQLDEVEDEELLLPLSKRDTHKIKTRGTDSQQHDGRKVAWEVDGALLESRNPRWHEFLAEWFTSKRLSLGISSTAVVDVVLKTMVLAETGARIEARRNGDTRGSDGVFGSLLVVLPGAFDGGDVVVQQPSSLELEVECKESEGDEQEGGDDDEKRQEEEAVTWRLGARGNAYGISCAAFYDCCEYIAEPVTNGAALCLVYDLVTTTPSEIPFVAGVNRLQQSVASALADFFDMAPAPLTKRLKISPDAWRTIYEFIVARHFAYTVNDDNFEDLYGSERRIYESLAAFCDQSGGQYVLYHAHLLCSKYAGSDSGLDDNRDDENATKDLTVTLTAPWIKHGASETFDYPSVTLRYQHEVAPEANLKTVPVWHRIDVSNAALKELLVKLHGDWKKAEIFPTCALVVLPVSIERSQIAKLPITDIAQNLSTLFNQSREEALQYAQRVVHYHSDWQLRSDEMEAFAEFVKMVVQINDHRLFTELLLAIHLKNSFTYSALASGVEHFGWSACAQTLVKSILSTPTLRGRVNFITAVFYESLGAEHLNLLLDALLSRYPWADVTTTRQDPSDSHVYATDADEFRKLLALTSIVSPERIQDVVSVPHAQEIVSLVVPALTRLIPECDEPSVMRAALHRVWELFQPMLVEIRNEPYAEVRIPEHCDKCQELQAFLMSTATDASMALTDMTEADHVRLALDRAAKYPAIVKITQAGDTAVRLMKRPGFIVDGFGFDAQVTAKRIHEVLFQRGSESEEDSDG